MFVAPSRVRIAAAFARSILGRFRVITMALANKRRPRIGVDLEPGVVLAGKYTLIRPLGAGGMGTVWAACNESTGADVALKVLLGDSDDGAEAIARFRREAYATAQLSHRGIVRIYDLLEVPGETDSLILVMELLRGRTLAAHLSERGRLPIDEAVGVAIAVLSALAHAHAAGIVHRDLKPDNILLALDPDGVVTPKILDFGVSKLRFPKAPVITHDGEMLGTPSYMSPEQVRGQDVDHRSDLFSLGIVLYEMLTGKNPFAAEGIHTIVVGLLEGHPPKISNVPPVLWQVIERTLRKDPAERFVCARDLGDALREVVGLPTTSSHPSLLGANSEGIRSGIQRCTPWLGWTAPPLLRLPRSPRSYRARLMSGWWVAAAVVLTVAGAAGLLWEGMGVP